eukprot:200215-Pyramimonas_sp.AAC.1
MAVLGGGGRMRAVPLGRSVEPPYGATKPCTGWVKRKEQGLCWLVADAAVPLKPSVGPPMGPRNAVL